MANAIIFAPLPLTAVTASTTAPGFDPAFVGNDYMGVVWRSSSSSSVDLIIDLGADRAFDTAMLLGCTGAHPGMTLQVSLSTQTAGPSFGLPTWSGPAQPFLAGAEMPLSGRGIALWRAPAGAPAAARYVRFRIAGLDGVPATVARVAIGQDLGLERNFAFGAAFGVRDLGTADFSRAGVLLRKAGAKLRTVGLSFPAVTRDEVERAVHPLIEAVGNTGMVALITDPEADRLRQRRCYFGLLVGELGTTWRKAHAFQAQANLVSVA